MNYLLTRVKSRDASASKDKSFSAQHGRRERGELKQESETETKMVLRAKNPRIAMEREQWVHGEKNLVPEFSGPRVDAPVQPTDRCSFLIPPGTLPMHSGELSKDGYINTK